jgi:hypothetical protein
MSRNTRAFLAGYACLLSLCLVPATDAAAQDSSAPGPPPLPRCATTDPNTKVANWDLDVYLCITAPNVQVADDVPQGISGGVHQAVNLPQGAYVTKVHVFHDSSRVYGLKFSYKLRGSSDTSEKQTEVIGGTSGDESIVGADYDKPLHFIKGYYGPDPAKYYRTEVLTGIDIGVYKYRTADSIPANASYNETFETKHFGAPARNPASAQGFDVHLVHALRGINACVSPTDRNGRIFALGAVVGAGIAVRSPAGTAMCPDRNPAWAAQPLGPRKLQTDNPFNDPKIAAANFDPYDFASGIFTREGQMVSRFDSRNPSDPNTADVLEARWTEPQAMLVEFGDTAAVSFSGMVNPTVRAPLITDEARKRRDRDYAFQYATGDGNFWIGVEIQRLKGQDYAFLNFDHKTPNRRDLIGRYREARLGDTGGDVVAKRNRDRADVVASGQSRKGLFELSNVAKSYDYILHGYDAPTMSLKNIDAGKKEAIFGESNAFQYYLSNRAAKAVPDGLLFFEIAQGKTDETQTIMASEREVSDTISQSISAAVPIRGVPVAASYSQTESSGMKSSSQSMMAMGTSRQYTHAFVLDKPNNFLSADFTGKLLTLYNASDSQRAAAAADMVNLYGTHYANAIIYGGLGFVKERMDAKTYGTMAEKAYTASLSAGDKSMAGVEMTQSESTKRVAATTSNYTSKTWESRGGAGSFSANGWNVAMENAVPVYYDLRTIDELIEPVILSKVLTGLHDPKKAEAARNALKSAIENRFAQFPVPGNASRKPAVYALNIKGIACINGGDEGEKTPIDLFGNITLSVFDGSGTREVVLFDAQKAQNLKCDGQTNSTVVGAQSPILWFADGSNGSAAAPVHPARIDYDLYEDDNSFTDLDDPAKGGTQLFALPLDFKPASAAAFIEFQAGGVVAYVEYEWQRLE